MAADITDVVRLLQEQSLRSEDHFNDIYQVAERIHNDIYGVAIQIHNQLEVMTGNSQKNLERQIEQDRKAEQAAKNAAAAQQKAQAQQVPDKKGGLLGGALFGLGAGIGIGSIGAGIAAFLTSLSGADSIISNLGSGENLKKLMINIAEGLEAFSGRNLVALGALMGPAALFGAVPLLSGMGSGIGIAAIGMGIAAFFTALAAGDLTIEKMSASGESISKLMKNVGQGIKSLLDSGAGLVVGGLFATGALFGALPRGVKTSAKAAIGIAAIGAGIAAFFTALGAGDYAISAMGANGESLGKMITNIIDPIKMIISDKDLTIGFGALFAAGAIFGPVAAMAGGKRGGKAEVGTMTGLAAVGAGISAFFASFALADTGIKALGSDGSRFKTLLSNIIQPLKEFLGDENLKSLLAGAAIAGGIAGLAGATGAGLVAIAAGAGGFVGGMAAVGLGIGAFFAGLSLGDMLINSEAGKNLGGLLKNVSESVKNLGGVDWNNVSNAGDGLASLGVGLAAFFGADIFKKGTDEIASIYRAAKDGILGLFGIDAATSKSPIQQMLDSLKPLETMDMKLIGNIDILAGAMDKLFSVFEKISNYQMADDFLKNMAKNFVSLGKTLRMIPYLVEGGEMQDDGSNWISRRLGTKSINFGTGLKNIKQEHIRELEKGISALQTALGFGIMPAQPALAGGLTDAAVRGSAASQSPALMKLEAMVTEQQRTNELLSQMQGSSVNVIGDTSGDTNVQTTVLGGGRNGHPHAINQGAASLPSR